MGMWEIGDGGGEWKGPERRRLRRGRGVWRGVEGKLSQTVGEEEAPRRGGAYEGQGVRGRGMDGGEEPLGR